VSPLDAPGSTQVPQKTLDTAVRNEAVRVVRVSGRPRLIQRLAALGIVPGAKLTVLKADNPTIVALGGARIALGNAVAESLEIEVI
jgi:Fe2+ transport system protein FeoA